MKRKLPLAPTALLIALALGSCARREADAETDAGSAATSAAEPTSAPQAAPPPPELAAVKVDVQLSPQAEAKLRSLGENVRVEVIYGGDAAPDATIEPNEMGLVELSRTVHELDGSGTLQFSEDDIDTSRLDQIVGQPQLMINVISGKKTTPQNLLACAFYWDTLSAAGKSGVQIPCTLSEES
ncbi:hypothetical protein [Luteimonas deserti]|uniref:Uncharacterized protein n=1 Tax=Luteimonas deserti TaxID=2752306 RepID=A0A7Z0TTW5_9GAMM|nr:hypothetical protein [Luteimonas deserti]NYZ62241.1 hypothetical protein [Luteimonas deserti]